MIEQVTRDQSETSWVDSVPGVAVSTSYQSQNTSSEAVRTGIDSVVFEVDGTTVTAKVSGPIDENGLIFNVTSEVALSTFSLGKNYLYLDTGATVNDRTISVTQTEPTFVPEKNGWYTGDNKRVFNSGVERYGKDTAQSIGKFKLESPLGTPLYFRLGFDLDPIVWVDEDVYTGKLLKKTTGEWLIEIPEIVSISNNDPAASGKPIYLYIVDSDGEITTGITDRKDTVFGDGGETVFGKRYPHIITNERGVYTNILELKDDSGDGSNWFDFFEISVKNNITPGSDQYVFLTRRYPSGAPGIIHTYHTF